MKLTSLFLLRLLPAHSLPRFSLRASVLILGLTLLGALPVRADLAGTVSNDPFDSSQATVVLNHDVIIDPINAFRTNGGFEDGHTLMRNGGLGSISFIEFQTVAPVAVRGVRLFAANDGAANSFRRALSRFRLLADADHNGSFETLVVDSGAINPDYTAQVGNAASDGMTLDLTLTNVGNVVRTAQQWRLEVTQGTDVQPFEGARVIEVDALPAPALVVTNTLDSGPGSLRQALIDVSSGGTITFAPELHGGTILVTGGELMVNRDVTILGPGATNLVISGGGSNRIFNIDPVTARISGLTLANGRAASGGAISSAGVLTLASCVFTNNYAMAQGGALAGRGPDRWVITGCTFSGNLADAAGGAFATGTINLPPEVTIEMLGRASSYTAINLNGTGTNRATVSPGAFVTLTANYTAVYTDGAGCPGCITQHYLGIDGTELECRNVPGSGSINVGFNAPVTPGVYYITQTATWWFFCDQFGPPPFVHDPVYAVAMLVIGPPPPVANSAANITNCTFSGNTARQRGGAVAVNASAVVQLSHSTVAGNSAPRGGGGVNVTDPNGELIIRNSIIAANSAAPGPDIAGAVTSLGHNLVGVQTTGAGLTPGVNGDQVGSVEFPIDPRLGPLQDNGGFPLTHALLMDSPAINAGTNTGAPPLDQRGAPRIACGLVDIGAVEFTPLPPAIICPTNIVAGADAGQCSRSNVTYTPTVMNGCPDPTVYCIPPSGSTFVLGTNVVLCAAMDATGNTNTCTFTVTIQNAEPPVLLCPTNLVMAADAGACVRSNVTFTVMLDLNCLDTSVACQPPSGSDFPAGVTPVTCTASNIAGTDVCMFTVTVIAHTVATALSPQTVEEGMNAMFCTTASGSGPVSYQWFHEGAPLVGQTNNCLALTEVTRAAGGEYCVRVSSPCGLTNQCAYLVVTSALAGPRVVSATIRQAPNDGLAQVAVIFSEDMDAVTLTNLSHYRLSGGPVLGVVHPPAFPHAIVLQTSMLECGRTYEVVLTGLQDGSGRFLNPNPTILSLTTTGLAYCGQSYTLDLPAGSSLIANQLNHDQNRLSQVLPEVPPATTVSLVTSNLTLDTYTFGPGGWSGDPVLNPGSGFFIHLDGPTNLTFRGSVPVPVLPLSLPAGPALVSAQKPERSSYTNVVGLPPAEGTLVFQHRPGAPPLPLGPVNFLVHMFVDGKWNMAEPVAEVGEAFFVDAFVPIQILTQPVSQLGVVPGASVMFSVLATGTGPLRYQWRRNGVNLPGQTNATLLLPNVQLAEAGDYTVVVANDFDARTSVPALLRLALPFLPLTNNFANAVLLEAPSGQGTRSNGGATAEPLEPLHAEKAGGKSMWIRWRTSVPGIATFRTTGSSFDTLLGVYRGPALGSLTTVASDEDSGGFLTSALQFSATPGEVYHIAIDGLAGEEGDIVLSWDFEATMETVPVFHEHPESQVVAMGSMVQFTVEVEGASSLQWYFRGAPIPDATTASLVIPSAGETNLGVYFVRAGNGTRVVDSRVAILQFNVTGQEVQQVFALDKFADAAAATPLQLGGTLPDVGFAPAEHGAAPASIVRGYTGTQVFNTTGATTSGGEEPICGAMGGASEWISFVAAEDGVLYLNTDGSSYDTVMAVFKRSVTGALQQIACDNNSGLDHLDSSLSVSVKAGVTNFIVIDGVNSATGNLKLNYSLVTPGLLTVHGFTSQNAQIVRFTGRAGAKFSIQRTTALLNWTTLITTNAANGVYDHVDLGSTNANARVRFYRAILLP